MTTSVPPDPSRSTPGARRRLPARAAAATLAAGLLTLAGAPAAGAHVRVLADTTTSGSYGALTFRVPNESEKADTVRVAVQLPQDRPFLSVSSRTLPGWTVTTTKEKLPTPATVEGTTVTTAVRTVTWTADRGAAVAPGQYQDFAISVGPLPAAGTVELPATQTYSDGSVVRWDQATPASGEEPEHPAPELVVTAGNGSGDDAAGDGAQASTTTTAVPGSRSDGVARGLGVAALVVAGAALALALVRRRGAA